MERPCYGRCGKTVPGEKIHCGHPDCSQKSIRALTDAIRKGVRQTPRKPRVFICARIPRGPLVQEWSRIVQSGLIPLRVPEKKGAA